MRPLNEILREMLTCGTPACGMLCGAMGVILAVLLLTIGLWKTLFIAALSLVGVFVGAVKDKGKFWRDLINKHFPPKE